MVDRGKRKMILRGKRVHAIFILLGGALGIVLFLHFWQSKSTLVPYDGTLITKDNHKIPVTIADTPSERQQGLSSTLSLSSKTGKLFIFEDSGMHGFWMKDMNYSIDMVWINSEFSIIGITEHVSPDTYPQAFYPPSLIQYVLEVNAGDAKKLNLTVGETITLEK